VFTMHTCPVCRVEVRVSIENNPTSVSNVCVNDFVYVCTCACMKYDNDMICQIK